MHHVLKKIHGALDSTRVVDFIAPLLLRLYLASIMIASGWTKASSFDSTAAWFGNPEWGLGLPAPEFMAFLATSVELLGGFLLLLGLATRYIAIPLMITMLVAAFAVHWDNGWFAIAPSDPDTSSAKPLAVLGIEAAEHSLHNSEEVADRLAMARNILRKHGNYGWLTGKGSLVVLNNGIEFAATYFLMLLVLFFHGAGRYFSLDYWIARKSGTAMD